MKDIKLLAKIIITSLVLSGAAILSAQAEEGDFKGLLTRQKPIYLVWEQRKVPSTDTLEMQILGEADSKERIVTLRTGGTNYHECHFVGIGTLGEEGTASNQLILRPYEEADRNQCEVHLFSNGSSIFVEDFGCKENTAICGNSAYIDGKFKIK